MTLVSGVGEDFLAKVLIRNVGLGFHSKISLFTGNEGDFIDPVFSTSGLAYVRRSTTSIADTTSISLGELPQ